MRFSQRLDTRQFGLGQKAGLDIVEHGMYGYPEQFIPEPELIGYGALPADTKGYAGAATVTAMTTTDGATA